MAAAEPPSALLVDRSRRHFEMTGRCEDPQLGTGELSGSENSTFGRVSDQSLSKDSRNGTNGISAFVPDADVTHGDGGQDRRRSNDDEPDSATIDSNSHPRPENSLVARPSPPPPPLPQVPPTQTLNEAIAELLALRQQQTSRPRIGHNHNHNRNRNRDDP